MPRSHFTYSAITNLYNSSKVLITANKGTYTHLTKDIYLELRQDVDYLGELLNQTGANWTANNYDWTVGTSTALDTDGRHWLSYITDLRSAVSDLWTTAGLSGSPSYTIATLQPLHYRGTTATTSGSVLTYNGVNDFTDVTTSVDNLYVNSGTGVTTGVYPITGKTSNTLTVTGTLGTSTAGDVDFTVRLSGNEASYTDVRWASLYTDIQDHLITISENSFIYCNADTGNDTTGDGSYDNPYQTFDKAVTIVNSSGGNIFLQAASTDYTVVTTLTSNNTLVRGSMTDEVVLVVPSGKTLAYLLSNTTFKYIYFGDGTTSPGIYVSAGISNIDFEYCVFRVANNTRGLWTSSNSKGTVSHCTFITSGSGSTTYGAYMTGSSTNYTFNNCTFDDVYNGILAQGTVTLNYCNFEDVTVKTTGSATFTNNNEHSSSTEPNILEITTGYLNNTSDLIDAASDGFDIGAYPDSPYNVLATATDAIGIAESAEMSLILTETDVIKPRDNVATETLNVSVDMMLGGLFFSDTVGNVSYLSSTDITPPALVAGFDYNGAALDVSWDNTGGDLCEVHIAVDDGVTDYTPASWWETNGTNPAITTAQTYGTRGYGIDLVEDTVTADEWGDMGSFSTVTADGVNDQQWDITLKVRVKNLNTGSWSEVATVSKTYNFNDFDDVVYYCADNPRTIADEYDNHANYLAQPYHTGTAKYTRPDGVDWSNDNRRFAYNPMYKTDKHMSFSSLEASNQDPYTRWKERKSYPTQPLGNNWAYTEHILYNTIACNYGNWNNAGTATFAAPSTAQPYDDGTATFISPVMRSATTGMRYLYLQTYWGSDCIGHTSQRGCIILMPSGELWAYNDFIGKPATITNTKVFYVEQDTQYVACQPNVQNYCNVKQQVGSSTPSGYAQYNWTYSEIWINTDNITGALSYGEIAWNKSHTNGSTTWADKGF
jgi:hypothetical protein